MIIFVPQYESLTIDHILDFAKSFPKVVRCFPPDRETRKMARAYICNVIHTVVPKEFREWVNKRMTDRNLALIRK